MDNTTLNYWPLVVVIEDCYVPELAQVVMETIADVHVNTIAAMLAVASYQASLDANRRIN